MGAMQDLLTPWKADPSPGTRPRLGILDRGAVPAEVSGLRGILQAGDEPELPPRSPEMGHGDGLNQDAGAEARHQRTPGLRPIRDHDPDGPGPSKGTRSEGGTRREATARSEMGWHYARPATIRSPRRSGATRRCRSLRGYPVTFPCNSRYLNGTRSFNGSGLNSLSMR